MKRPTIGTTRRQRVAVLPLETADGTTVLQVPDTGVCIEALERALIVFALAHTAGNRTRAARLLGLTRSALLYRMRKHGLDDPEPPPGEPTSEETL
ncbi:MAG TPA: helix-turn-helix domain-containing protein [Vicinamibacterales bacterium]|nr:helix-turn-helix domain-containing protein [Vicinamibacterales bacterium]